MKLSRYTLMLVGVTVLTTASSDGQIEFPPLFGTTPDSAVKNWIKYVVVGPQNSLLPIVLISPQIFETSGYPESLIVLPQSKYDLIDRFTHNRMSLSDCKSDKRQVAEWYSIEMSDHDNARTQKCVLPQASACRYLSGVLQLSGVDWSDAEHKPIDDLVRSIKCKIASR